MNPEVKVQDSQIITRTHRSLFPSAGVLMQAPLETGAWGREFTASKSLMPQETKVSVVHFAGPDHITRSTNLDGSLIRLSYVYPMKGQTVKVKSRSYPSIYLASAVSNRFETPLGEISKGFARPTSASSIGQFISRPVSSYEPKTSTRATTAGATRPQTAGYMRPGSRSGGVTGFGGFGAVDAVLKWRRMRKTGEYANIETGKVVQETPEILFNASHDLPLPIGWHRAIDAGLGLAYYWRDGQEEVTSWEFPVEEVDEVEIID